MRRLSTLVAALVVGLLTLGLTGCGSTGDGDDTSFVATTPPTGNTTTGAVTFNFVAAQFAVGATASQLRIEFFPNTTQAAGTASLTVTVPFAATVTVQNVPVTTQSFRVTSLNQNNVPLVTIVQNITVVADQVNTVAQVATPQPVQLNQIAVVNSNVFPPTLANQINQFNLQVNATGQIYLVAVYSNGDVVIVGDQATYQVDPNNANAGNIFSVGTRGELLGKSAGAANLVITFGNQTLQLPIIVEAANQVQLTTLALTNANPLQVAATASAVLGVTGTSGGQLFGIDRTLPALNFSITGSAGITVSNAGTTKGTVSVAEGTAAGSTATVTVTYTNPDNTTLTATIVINV